MDTPDNEGLNLTLQRYLFVWLGKRLFFREEQSMVNSLRTRLGKRLSRKYNDLRCRIPLDGTWRPRD